MMVFRLFSYKRHFTTSKGAKRLETGKTKRTLHVKNAFPSFANFWIDKTRLKRIFLLKLWKKWFYLLKIIIPIIISKENDIFPQFCFH